MSKLTNMLGVMSGILLFCYFTGVLPSSSATGGLMSLILDPSSISSSNLAYVIGGIITIAGLFGTVYFSRFTPSDFYVMAPVITVFLGFGYDFLVIAQTLSGGGPAFAAVATLIFGPFTVLYVIGVVEWWRGGI